MRKTGLIPGQGRATNLLISALAFAGVCVSCGSSTRQPPPTIWEASLPSPDGLWIAAANTIQNGGFGSASIDTTVSLRKKDASGSGALVLAFSCNGPAARPYVLDNKANAGGTIDLQMKWLSPSHLDVTYDNDPSLEFQVTKHDGIDISAREVSNQQTAPSP
jgi:hypothetical protein